MAFSVSGAIDSVGNALSNVANAINNAFGNNTSTSDPYSYDDQPYITGDGRPTVYDVADPSAVLKNGPLELGGIAHMSEKNVLDGYVKTLLSNNTADNNTAAKNAFYFVDEDGSAPGAIDVDMTGNAKANLMVGTAGENVIKGRDGADVLVGRDGNDILDGGNGNDRITGGRGSDWVSGGAGSDEFHMGGGNDVISAGSGDEVWTGAGNDRIQAGAGAKFTVRNFALDGTGTGDADVFDFADANESNYRTLDVSGFKIVQDDGVVGITIVDSDLGHMTLQHRTNGTSVDVSFAESYYVADSWAEAKDILDNPLRADGWIDII